PDGKVQYTVSVKTIGGRAIPNLFFAIYKGNDLTAYGETDASGIGTVDLVPGNDYTVELSTGSLKGYNVESRYSFVGRSANIVLTSSVILDSDLTGVSYKVGDVMRDFTVMTTDGTPFQLSEALKTKKGVLINFWFSTCSPCINEFPYMQSAYEKYSDDIAIIGLNNYPTDNENTVRDFKASMGLTFPCAKDFSRLGSAFGITGYPTSIFVDRYGTICLIEVGGLTSEKPFTAAFEHFSATDYTQKLFSNISELTPIEKPNIDMPSSEEIAGAFNGTNHDGSDFSAIYSPETNSSDAEYSWPFLIGQTPDNQPCIYPANSFKDSSFATMHATVTLKAGEALAFDWFADTELGVDILYLLVDGKDIYRISGTSSDWKTCYPYVALEDGTHEVSFIYLKDDGIDAETDRVLLRNFRTVLLEDVDTETYIPREAATKPNANGVGFQNYITPVFNPVDGYYHVGTADGPILLVNLMNRTQLNEESLNLLGYNGTLTDAEGDIYETLVTYCNYAINGTLYGFSPVTEELKGLLVRIAEIIGFERNNPNQWLQACCYYDAYGTDGKQLEDPVKGVAFFAAFDTLETTDPSAPVYNTVVYDGRVIMPRGLKYKFVPTKSGAYLIQSQSTDEVDGWIFG
ncbi:MAG: TlpA family protein disulfide reductase, partial [Clostridia bacterium]|nr:TlpA family protein disulfide reductase [Clostridia bacterium]